MLGASPTASSDNLRASLTPLLGESAKASGVCLAAPTARSSVPNLAGVGIDDDRLRGSRFQLADQRGHKSWGGAVDPNGDDLRDRIKHRRAFRDSFAMGDAVLVPAGKAYPGSNLPMVPKGSDDGTCLFERGNGLEGDQVGVGFGEDGKPAGVEGDQLTEGEIVVAVIFGAIVQGRSVGAKRGGDQDFAGGLLVLALAGFLGETDGLAQAGGGVFGRETDFCISLSGNLVASG